MNKFNILDWWLDTCPLRESERVLINKHRENPCSDSKSSVFYEDIVNTLLHKMPCSGIDAWDGWKIFTDECASNHIDNLFNYYVDNDTLVVISNAEHETTVKNFNKCKNGLILDHSRDIRGYNYDKVIEEAKKYKKVFFYCIGTQISTGEISPQTFFVELKRRFYEENIKNIMVLDDVQGMFFVPRDYSIFDYIIGTAHAICWEYDLGLLITNDNNVRFGKKDFRNLNEFNEIVDVILDRKDKINMFSRCIHEYFNDLLARPEFSIIEDGAPQLCSIRCKGIKFTEEIKNLLDKYEIRIEAFGQEVQFIRFRAQMFIKDDTLLLKGIRILEYYLKGILG